MSPSPASRGNTIAEDTMYVQPSDSQRRDLQLDDPIEQLHHRVDTDQWENIYVVGDIHGCRSEFERLLERIDLNADDLVVVVGDLIRKGPDSEGVIDIVRERSNVRSVRGNNEDKVLRGDADLPSLDDADHSFLSSLPVAISWDTTLVVHGGVDPKTPLEEHDTDDMLTMRAPHGDGYDGPFWFEEYDGSPRVFFGHTVLEEPVVTDGAVGLDTGCVYGGELTAYDVSTSTLISIPAEETYQKRSQDSIVSPDDYSLP